MADDKSKTDQRDRSRVAGNEDYEVVYLARLHGISVQKVHDLIVRHGNDREKLERAIEKEKK